MGVNFLRVFIKFFLFLIKAIRFYYDRFFIKRIKENEREEIMERKEMKRRKMWRWCVCCDERVIGFREKGDRESRE